MGLESLPQVWVPIWVACVLAAVCVCVRPLAVPTSSAEARAIATERSQPPVGNVAVLCTRLLPKPFWQEALYSKDQAVEEPSQRSRINKFYSTTSVRRLGSLTTRL